MLSSSLSRIAERPVLRAFATGAGWMVAQRVLPLLLNFFASAWFIRYMGPERYGSYAYALSFVGLLSAVANLGLEGILVRELSRSEDRAGELLGTAVALRLISGFVATGAAIGLAALFAEGENSRAVSVASIALAVQFPTALGGWFQARMLLRPTAIVAMLVSISIAGVKILFVLAELPLSAFLWLFVVSHVMTGIGTAAAFYKYRPPVFSLTFDQAAARELLRKGAPLLLGSLSVSIYMKIDQVMLQHLVGIEAVGLYAPAVSLSEVWNFLPVAIAAAAFPVIARSAVLPDRQALDMQMQSLYDGIALLGYAVAVPVGLLAVPLTTSLFGSTYEESGRILAVHIVSFVFVSLGSIRSRYLVARDMGRFLLLTSVMGAVLNVLLNFALIPRWSGLGAAWATSLSYALSSWLSGLLVADLRRQVALQGLALLAPFRIRSILRSLT